MAHGQHHTFKQTLLAPFKVEVPKVEVPKIEVPTVQVPKIEVPTVQVPKIEVLPTVEVKDEVPKEGFFAKSPSGSGTSKFLVHYIPKTDFVVLPFLEALSKNDIVSYLAHQNMTISHHTNSYTYLAEVGYGTS
jgi:hypothetical protein